ncbi:hypothetical protein [Dyella caseinilytica]|uniref:ABC-2 type transport system permease protein n=1 Tax=Dyella caseinilytica TaxID=1849581 RepID=A0ABX7GUS4_9GAMM|nr:hypothetical protein [Dyella caseinilytica]QRN54214.1 hypothetical protein ISN74_02100 [Dyella caseinilytica]GFZ92422.1 hypothetical protein GCM10011408_09950 [Dyella caseinilytica]
MKAWWQLLLQLFLRMPVLVLIACGLWVAALYFAVQWLHGEPRIGTLAVALFSIATWAWHIGQGQNLRGLCVPESFLLPRFRQRLLEYGAIDAVLWVLLPLLLAVLLQLPHILLIASGLLLIATLGLIMGCNPRASLFIWPAFIVLGWAPALVSQVIKVAIDSPLTPLLILAVTALLLKLSITPLLRIEDRETGQSPMESTGLDRGQMRSAPGEPSRRGNFAKRILELYDQTAQRTMQRALNAYKLHPSVTRRMVLVRRLLLPHDNPEAIALRIVLVAVFVCFYVFAVMHRQHFEPQIIGAYAVMLSISRFPQLSVGLIRMRPNMADLYLTLAPETRAEYQKTVSDALLVLIPISMLTALVYTSLGIVLVHAADPWHMLFVAAVVSASASLAALALHLIGPEGKTGRTIANLVVVMGVMAVYWGGYWLVGTAGYLIGGSVLAVITLSFGFGVWFAAQREYQQRSPRFDAPMG